ncbi:MAG: DHHA1 domain-containing protein [Clostridia bacterium]|nr:DHHA1 domain-containing protein [Clostridia bacterium]
MKKLKDHGRTPHGISLYEVLDKCKEHLIQFGGHDLAAGVTLETDKIEEFSNAFETVVKETKKDKFEAIIPIDLEITEEDLQKGITKITNKLLPFGQKNPEPIFLYRNLKVNAISTLKEDKHLKLTLGDEHIDLEVIGFSQGNRRDELRLGDHIDVVGTININEYSRENKEQMILKDFKKII